MVRSLDVPARSSALRSIPAVEEEPLPRDSYSKWSDTRLVEECLQKNEQAWLALIGRYKRLIYSFPIRYGASPEDAADVFQAVCVHLFSELPRLRKRGSLRSWLISVAAHQSFHWKRRRQLRIKREGMELDKRQPDGGDLPSALLERAEREQRMRDALSRLSPSCQELIRLLFYEHPTVPYSEVARRLGLATGSIGLTRGRCLKRLQAALERMGL